MKQPAEHPEYVLALDEIFEGLGFDKSSKESHIYVPPYALGRISLSEWVTIRREEKNPILECLGAENRVFLMAFASSQYDEPITYENSPIRRNTEAIANDLEMV